MFFKILKNAIIFGFFAFVTSSITAIVNELTKYKINSQIEQASRNLLACVLPVYLYNNNVYKECYLIKNKELGDTFYHRFWLAKKKNQVKAIAIEITTKEGYSGLIKILLGMDIYGNVLGVRVINHHETPGIGDKISIDVSDWITYFSGMHVLSLTDINFELKKHGGQIYQFTGATITPQAIVNVIKKTVIAVVKISSKISKCKVCGNNNEIK